MKYFNKLIMPLFFVASPLFAQPSEPTIESWMLGNGATGFSTDADLNSFLSTFDADILEVWYTPVDVFVVADSIPSHPLSPWGSRNTYPAQTDSTWKLPRTTSTTQGSGDSIGVSAAGVFVNGVHLYSWSDASSYNDEGAWSYIAQPPRRPDVDENGGHPAPGGMTKTADGHTHRWTDDIHHSHESSTDKGTLTQSGAYHYHNYPVQLADQLGDDGSDHSPILGFAFDGNPIYGPYGYANTDGTGGIVLMESGWALRSITDRTTVINEMGMEVSASSPGPAINASNPLGTFREDYFYDVSNGNLDEFNGRLTVTPEYPSGIYAYFTTIDAMGEATFPYTIGPDAYYGSVISENIGMGAGNTSIPGMAVMYDPNATVGDWENFEN